MAPKVGVVGLGQIGRPMAANLVKAGFDLMVYDVRPEPMRELESRGAKVARSPRDVGSYAEIVSVVVVDDAQVEAAVLGNDGVLDSLSPSSIIVCQSTIRPNTLMRIAEQGRHKGVGVIDAPVSGGMRGADEGSLCIMVGGEKALVDRCWPLFEACGSNVFHLGALGKGLIAKLAHQTIVAINIMGAAEGMALAEACGVAPKSLQPVIHAAGAQSRIADNWVDFHPGSHAANLFHKDLTIALEVGHQLGLSMPGAEMVRGLLPKLVPSE